jgi:crossover junction endodeoxyribonuclease RusA
VRGFENEPADWAPASVWFDDDGNRQQTVEFIVPGRPVPKGNLIKGRYGGYHDPTVGIDAWVSMVHMAAYRAMQGKYRARMKLTADDPIKLPMFTGAVMVDVTFVLYRPKSTPKRHTPPAVKKPDNDKLVRAVFDGMTDVVYSDDSQVVEHHARKRLADIDESPGAIILVTSNVKVK